MSRVPPIPRLVEMVASCVHNLDVADLQRRQIRRRLEGVPLGPERDELEASLNRYESDRRHWADYVAYYRGRAAREGELAVPSMGRGGSVEGAMRRLGDKARAPEPDRRLPREPGDDDG